MADIEQAVEIVARTLHAVQESGASGGTVSAESAAHMWHCHLASGDQELYRSAARLLLAEIGPLMQVGR